MDTSDPTRMRDIRTIDPADFSATHLARFWSRVDRSDLEGCWEWTAGTSTQGYGRFCVGKRSMQAHRVSAVLAYRECPALWALHTCDNPACCNPNHLFFGSNVHNTADKFLKGRCVGLKGSANPRAKLTVDDVRRIRQDQRSQAAIAADYGVSPATIGRAKSGESWGHLR